MRPTSTIRRRFGLKAAGLMGMLFSFGTFAGAYAQSRGISYTLAPLIERTYFDPNAGLGDATLAGARVGFGFGRYAELSGSYLVSSGLKTDFGGFTAFGDRYHDPFRSLLPRDVRLTQVGGDLKINVGGNPVFPYLSIGAGVLQFDPENIDKSRTIYLSGAAGLQIGISSRMSLLAQVSNVVYRYSPQSTLLSENDAVDLQLGTSGPQRVDVRNLSVRIGLQIYAGGRAQDELSDVDQALRGQFSRGLAGIRLQLEPIGGSIHFADELGFRKRQSVVGAFAGLDLGPYMGLRGFYWRGLRAGTYRDIDDLQAYGGEIRLRFGRLAAALSPHLNLGGGYLDVLAGYEGNGVVAPVDRPFALGGVGVSAPLFRGLAVYADARAILMTTEHTDELSRPSQISTNLFYSAGIRFGLGGRHSERATPRQEVTPGSLATLRAEMAAFRVQMDSLVAVLRRVEQPSASIPRVDSVLVGSMDRFASGSLWIAVPWPFAGELHVRYGDLADSVRGSAGSPARIERAESGTATRDTGEASGGEDLTTDDVRAMIRQAVQRELQPRYETPAPAADSTEQRLERRIAALEARIDARERAATVQLAGRSPEPPFVVEAVSPIAGFGFSADQIGMAGLRAELRSNSLKGARFLPELVTSVGSDGVAFGGNADVAFPLGLQVLSFRPYVGLGLGLTTVNDPELVFNVLAGLTWSGYRGQFILEYMSQDFLDLNRVVVGYKIIL